MSLLSLSRWHTSASRRHVAGYCARHSVGLSPVLNFRNMSQALSMHYLRPWLDVALLSQACVLRVFQRCWKNQQRFHWHATKWHRQYSSCCYGYSSQPHVLMTVSYSKNCFNTFKIDQLWGQHRQNIHLSSALCSLFPDHSSQGNLEGHFFSHYVHFKSKDLKMIKDSTQSFSGFHTKRV